MGQRSEAVQCATVPELRSQVVEARARSLDLLADLDDAQLTIPYLPTVNPVLWELCHLTYFQEFWVLRRGAGQEPLWANADSLFDSMTVDHEERWRLPVPSREEVLDYMASVRDRVLDLLDSGPLSEDLLYLIQYAVFHEDMHAEALSYTRQALGYPPPSLGVEVDEGPRAEDVSGDAHIEGGTHRLGAPEGPRFCFDNEKWAHPVVLPDFSISRAAVSEGEFADFIQDGGYEREELWAADGWRWRLAVQATLPLYWRRGAGGFERRHFDRWLPIEAGHAMIHVSWYEADAFARWAGRRLPTEAEWERAASWANDAEQRAPGGPPVAATEANLDWRGGGPVHVGAHAAGDSPSGCRQMFGNVWEWTDSTFAPYPGFVADMYVDYSQTSFHTRKVLRGGCWATRSRMMRTTLRNFFQPGRRDVFSGFRTCARDP